MDISKIKTKIVNYIKSNISEKQVWFSYDNIISNPDLQDDEDSTQLAILELVYSGVINCIPKSNNISNDFTLDELLYSIEEVRLKRAEEYRQMHVNEALEGFKELEKIYAENENYEKAAYYRDRINQVLNNSNNI